MTTQILYRLAFFCLLMQKLSICSSTENTVYGYNQDEQSSEYWNNQARETLQLAEKRQPIVSKAKNVILFLGDGMGVSTMTAARIRKGQVEGRSGEEGALNFENFDNVALIKTYNVDYQVPDSAGTATAYLTGVKANMETIGVNARVNTSHVDCDHIRSNSVHSIMEIARLAGKAIGVVTTTRITHASPAAAYAHAANREWEYDSIMPEQTRAGGCHDIAYQLINQEPGNSFNVIFGGGRRNFLPRLNNQKNKTAYRTDGINLIDQWKSKRAASGLSADEYAYIETKDQLSVLDEKRTKYVLGLFNDDNLAFNSELSKYPDNPSLNEMTTKAVKILSQNPNGYILFVEGGRIDQAHHRNMGVMAVEETIQFDEAIGKTMHLVNKHDTLVVVTADHSHTLVMNGYPRRGNDIYGTVGYFEHETEKHFTTLTYGNGPGYVRDRPDAAQQNTSLPTYVNFAGVNTYDSYHAGEDVALYSQGPMAHLYYGLKEQNFIPHVMQYATCIGFYKNEPHCHVTTTANESDKVQDRLSLQSWLIRHAE